MRHGEILPIGAAYYAPENPTDFDLSHAEFKEAFEVLETYLHEQEGLYPDAPKESGRLMVYDARGRVVPCSPDLVNSEEGRRYLVQMAMARRLFAYPVGHAVRHQIVLFPPEKSRKNTAENQMKKPANPSPEDLSLNTPDHFKKSKVKDALDNAAKRINSRWKLRVAETSERIKTDDEDIINTFPEKLQKSLREKQKNKPVITFKMKLLHYLTFSFAYKKEFREVKECEQPLKQYKKKIDTMNRAFRKTDEDRINAVGYYSSEEKDMTEEAVNFIKQLNQSGEKAAAKRARRYWNRSEDKDEQDLAEIKKQVHRELRERDAYNSDEREYSRQLYDAGISSLKPKKKQGNQPAPERQHQEEEAHQTLRKTRVYEEAEKNEQTLTAMAEQCAASLKTKDPAEASLFIRELIVQAVKENPSGTKGTVSLKAAILLYDSFADKRNPLIPLIPEELEDLEPYMNGLKKLDRLMEEGRNAKIALMKHEAGTELLDENALRANEDNAAVFRMLSSRLEKYSKLEKSGKKETAAVPASDKKTSLLPEENSTVNDRELPKALTDEASPLAKLCGQTSAERLKKMLLKERTAGSENEQAKGQGQETGSKETEKVKKVSFRDIADRVDYPLSAEEIKFKKNHTPVKDEEEYKEMVKRDTYQGKYYKGSDI